MGAECEGEANTEIEVAPTGASQTSMCTQVARGLVKTRLLIPLVWVGPESLHF